MLARYRSKKPVKNLLSRQMAAFQASRSDVERFITDALNDVEVDIRSQRGRETVLAGLLGQKRIIELLKNAM